MSNSVTQEMRALAAFSFVGQTEIISGDGIPTNIETFLQAQLVNYFAAHRDGLPAPGLYDRLLCRMEKPLITQTLRATGGNQIKAAEILGINRNTLRKKMRELGIDARQLKQDAA